MIKHTQTFFGDGSDGSTPGNCFQASVAGILDLPLEDVPHFVAMDDWWGGVCDWVAENDYLLYRYEPQFDEYSTYEEGWLVTAPVDKVPHNRVSIASGMGPRGYQHAVLWQHGKLAHDPHPSRDGLLGEPEDYWIFEKKASID